MPYIKQEYRPKFQEIIDDLKSASPQSVDTLVFATKDGLENIPVDKRDGCLNFILTRILMRETSMRGIWSDYINKLLNEVFMVPSYLGFERMLGLIFCVNKELARRGWWTTTNLIFLNNLEREKRASYSDYEDRMIEENGDLE